MLQKQQQGRSPVGLLDYKVTNPGDYAARAKTSSLAAFAVTILLDLRSSPTVLSMSLLVALSKPNSGPS
jgi:hypothetical protein